MTAVKRTSPDRIGLNSTGGSHTCAQIISDIADVGWCDTLLTTSATQVYLFNYPIEVDNDAVWEDDGRIILHTVNGSGDAIIFAGAGGGRITFGEPGPFTETGASDDEPVTSARTTSEPTFISACCYSFVSNNSSQTWTDGGAGVFQMHGGMMMFRDDAPNADNDLYEINFPETTNIIQCNVEHIGGGTFNGTGFRVQESTFKSSNNEGMKFAGATAQRFQDVIFHDMIVALNLGSGAVDNTLRRVQFRGCTDTATYSGYTGDFELIDSDNLASDGGIESGSTIGSGGHIYERNSVNVSFVNEAGAAITDVRALVYQTSSEGDTAYGAEMITTYPERLALRTTRDVDNDITPVSAGNFSVRARRYASLPKDVEFVPASKGFAPTFVMFDDPFTVLTEGNAAAITGVVLDKGNKELELTTRSTPITPSELYDFLKAKLDDSTFMDVPELFATTSGTNFTMPASWTIVDQQNFDLSGGEIVVGRYVPVTITGVVENARCAVVKDPFGTPVVIGEGVVATSQTTITLTTTFTVGATIAIRARLAGRKPFETVTALSSSGQTVNAASQFIIDTSYTS